MTDTEILDHLERWRFAPIPVFDRRSTKDKSWDRYKIAFVGWTMGGEEKTYSTIRETVIRWSERAPRDEDGE